MTTTTAPPPPWFLRFWEQNCQRFPLLLRGESAMIAAWGILKLLLDFSADYATTPEGIKTLTAFAKIQAIMVESQIIANSPDPSPEQVAEAVQRLVDRSKV